MRKPPLRAVASGASILAVSAPGDGDTPDDTPDPMRPESWFGVPDVCGSCIAWRCEDPKEGEEVASGSCRLRRELPRVPAKLRKCDLYKPRGKFVYQPGRSAPEKKRKKASAVRVMRRDEASGEMVTTQAPAPSRLEPRERPPVPREVEVGTDDRGELRATLKDIFHSQIPDAGRELLPRFERGTVTVVGKEGQTREVSAEDLFRMIEGFRTAVEALEDQVVSKDALLDQFTELNKQLRSIYGTFTTFNFLYADRAHYFSSKG